MVRTWSIVQRISITEKNIILLFIDSTRLEKSNAFINIKKFSEFDKCMSLVLRHFCLKNAQWKRMLDNLATKRSYYSCCFNSSIMIVLISILPVCVWKIWGLRSRCLLLLFTSRAFTTSFLNLRLSLVHGAYKYS